MCKIYWKRGCRIALRAKVNIIERTKAKRLCWVVTLKVGSFTRNLIWSFVFLFLNILSQLELGFDELCAKSWVLLEALFTIFSLCGNYFARFYGEKYRRWFVDVDEYLRYEDWEEDHEPSYDDCCDISLELSLEDEIEYELLNNTKELETIRSSIKTLKLDENQLLLNRKKIKRKLRIQKNSCPRQNND